MNPNTSTVTPPRKPRFRWLRRLFASAVILAVVVTAAALGLRAYFLHVAEERYQAAVAEADRLDPGWRWEDILKNRKTVPDEENSARHVLAAANMLPDPEKWSPKRPPKRVAIPPDRAPDGEPADGWPIQPGPSITGDQPFLDEEIKKCAPPERLPADLARDLRDELDKVKPALQEARRAADLPKGRYEIKWRKNFLETLMPHAQRARVIGAMLQLDAVSAAQEGDFEGALVSSRAVFNVGRSFGDEPILVSLLIRFAEEQIAVGCVERILAQGEVSERSLAAFQQRLAAELAEPVLLTGMRGERAGMTEMLGAFYTGELRLGELSGGTKPQPPTAYERFCGWLYIRPRVRRNQAVYLEKMTGAIETLKGPAPQQRTAFRQLEQDAKEIRVSSPHLSLVALFVKALHRVVEADHRRIALLQSARVALAAERFRLLHGEWPQTPHQLVPALLDKIPDDPFGDGPLRFRRLEDGIVVYSVGPNEVDDGGEVDRRSGNVPADIGFRLWDPEWRRQPPSAEPAAEPDERGR
jgi:hypothetical protein